MTRVALVTGASRGIGRDIAQRLAEEGMEVLGTSTTKGGAQSITNELAGHGKGYVLNVSDEGSIGNFFDAIKESHDAPLVLVNNAGSRIVKPILDHSEDDWQRMLDVNLTGHFHCCQAVLPHMLAAGFGRIVNVASVAGSVGRPNRIGYVAAKGGTLAMTRALAADMAGKNITVNALAPGMIASPMNQAVKENPDFGDNWNNDNLVRRWGMPEDVAGIAAFLASDEASFITGETINVDGGSIAALIRRGE